MSVLFMSEINTLSSNQPQKAVDAFWEALPPFWQSVSGFIRKISAEQFDITVEQFHILRHIRKGHGTVSELAQAKQISRPAISQSVEVLVNKGLVTRRQDSRDRRSTHLELTEKGNALLNAIFEQTRNWMAEAFSSLEEEDLDQLVRGLEVLKKVGPA
jgi:DNA-binding MarR family transcriptional regulator